MEPLIVNSVVEVDKDFLVGDTVFALFDSIWFKGIIQELRPKNKRDKFYCMFEDGDGRSMNIKCLYKLIPSDSKLPTFALSEANLVTEAPNTSSISNALSNNLVEARTSVNQPVEDIGAVSTNNEFSDSARDLTPGNLCESFSLIHSDGPTSYYCIYKVAGHSDKCLKSFNSLQKYQKHLDKHRSNDILGTIPDELLKFIRSMVCSVCNKLVAMRCTKGIHPSCEKHAIRSSTTSSLLTTSPLSTISTSSLPLPSLHDISLVPKHFLYATPPPQILDTWREVYSKTITDIVSYNNIYYWSLYYMLPYCILVRPVRGGKKNSSKKSQLNLLFARLKRWKEGDFASLWSEATQLIDHMLKNSRSCDSYQQNNQMKKKKVFKLVAQGRFSDACKSVSSSGIAPSGVDTFNKLKSKHPEGPEYETPPNLPRALDFTIIDVMRAVYSFSRGSSGGIFAWTPDLIKYTLDRDNQTKENSSFACLVNLVSSGEVIDEVKPFLAGASLTALNKEGADVRPIASGDPLRRVVSKCYCYNMIDDIREHFEPLQHGCSINGTERIVHLFRDLVDKEAFDSTKLVLKLDMKNAFNSVSRQAIFAATVKHFPSLSRYVYWCYGKHTHLKYDDYYLLSQLGVQQGDPLGPILFCLALHAIITRARDLFPDMIQGWYCDDGQVIASPQVIAKVFAFLVDELKVIGLDTNFKKTELIALNINTVSIDNISSNSDECLSILSSPFFITGRNFYTLGAPIGDEEYCNQFIASKVSKIANLINKIVDLENIQVAYNLIYYCCSYGKVVYYSRTVPSQFINSQLIRFDNIVLSSFESLISKSLNQHQVAQLSLPWKMGGLGLRSSFNHSCAAYISSFSHCRDVVVSLGGPVINNYLDYCINAFNNFSLGFKLENADSPQDQSLLSGYINDKLSFDLSSGIELDHKAKLLGITAQYAHYWLTVIPDPAVGLTLNNYEMSTLLKFWLNLDILPSNNICPEVNCNARLDAKGVHAIVCKSHGDRISKHNAIIDVIEKEARLAAKNPYKEVLHLLGSNDDRRPADLFIPNHYQNKSTCLDIGISNPLCPSYIVNAASIPLSAAESYTTKKIKKYKNTCDIRGLNYIPLCGETTGGWSDASHKIFDELIRASALRRNIKKFIARRSFYQRLSFQLQKMNVLMIQRRDIKLIS